MLQAAGGYHATHFMNAEIQRYRANLRDELNGAALYAALAAAEADPLRKDLFLQLAEAESSHAQLWRDKLAAAGVQDKDFLPDFRTRLLARLAQRFGPRFVLPTIAAAEFADRNKYAGQSDAHAISAEERGHAALIQAVAANASGGSFAGANIARAEPWHRGAASGNNLRAAVLGANDGLVSNFCLIMGIAGAGATNRIVLLTGLAGLVAGACSMALDTLAREELGIDPAELGGNPWGAAATSFLLFSAGAIFPAAPFFGLKGDAAIVASAVASAAVLGAVGMLTSLFNGRPPWYSALRQLIFGCRAASVTYGAGALIGSSLS
jgi:vacuolar iron transporter family protein